MAPNNNVILFMTTIIYKVLQNKDKTQNNQL